jgi:hypothetical protein
MKKSKNSYNFSDMIKNCHYIPWSGKDNPNGWIEPTTFCQLKCPGCYRGLDKAGAVSAHLDLDELKKQIDKFVEIRNVETISIAGGEPLLYPDLEGLILYIKSCGLKSRIFTNGIALNELFLKKLKKWGANEIIIHIDKFQTRNGVKANSEGEVNLERASYCNIFRKVGGVNLGFIQPFSKNNLSDVSEVLRFCKNNDDVISVIVFTLYSDVNWEKSLKFNINTDISVSDVMREVKENFEYEPCSYLGSTIDKSDPTWLFSISVSLSGSHIGFFDGKFSKYIEDRYYNKNKKYLITRIGNHIPIFYLVKYIRFKCVRNILKNYILFLVKNPLKIKDGTYLQWFLILRGPKLDVNGERDLCSGCPDPMFYNGKLVPSCILDEVKMGRKYKFKDWKNE